MTEIEIADLASSFSAKLGEGLPSERFVIIEGKAYALIDSDELVDYTIRIITEVAK